MATFSKILLKRMTENISVHPLTPGEFRGIERMGNYYISLEPTWNDAEPLFMREIGGQTTYIYYRPA